MSYVMKDGYLVQGEVRKVKVRECKFWPGNFREVKNLTGKAKEAQERELLNFYKPEEIEVEFVEAVKMKQAVEISGSKGR